MLVWMMAMAGPVSFSQVNNWIAKGNEAYRQGDFSLAIESYKEALRKEPENAIACYNLANALQHNNDFQASQKYYDQIIRSYHSPTLNASSFYNKALSFLKQKNLVEAINSLKQSLKLNPEDDDARENLQKAINELKQKQNQQQPREKNAGKNRKSSSKPLPVNQEMMEQKFAELKNQEKQLQRQLQKRTGAGDAEKDW